tara:strand:- start:43 stop:468 length:426 start_codon:yes stop_codon:yes gene_type:complete
MKNFVTLVLILLLAGLGPVSGAMAHSHDIHSPHDHGTVDHSASPDRAHHGSLSDHSADVEAAHAQTKRDDGHSTFEVKQISPADADGKVFHIHTATDGAPDGVAEMKLLIAFAPIPRRLENSDQIIGPVPAILPRPPKQIL